MLNDHEVTTLMASITTQEFNDITAEYCATITALKAKLADAEALIASIWYAASTPRRLIITSQFAYVTEPKDSYE
jgi:hypothetical protein